MAIGASLSICAPRRRLSVARAVILGLCSLRLEYLAERLVPALVWWIGRGLRVTTT